MNLSIAREVADNSDNDSLQGLNKKRLKFLEARKYPGASWRAFPPIVVDIKVTSENK